MEAWPVRGIANPTGTSCHVGSALVLLNYCLEPLKSMIVAEAAENSRNDDVIHVVGQLFRHNNSPEGIHVKLVFDTLRKEVGIEARDFGDVITTFMKLIHYLVQQSKDSDECHEATTTIASIWDQCCNAGKVHSLLLGDCNEGCDCSTLCKEMKPRSMPIPFRVEMSSCGQPLSLMDAIRKTLQPKPVKDYEWESCHHSCEHVQTSRTLCIDHLPSVWLLHLDWFSQPPNGESAFCTTRSIPSKLTAHEITETTSDLDENRYHELVGGILLSQVHDEKITDERDRRHYLSLIRSKDNIWYLLDDDEVPQVLSEERCLALFGGVSHGDESPFREKGEHVSVCGYLLVYREAEPSDKLTFASCRDKSLSSDVDWTLPNTLVGRRLRIRWAKGTFYGGVVDSYDATTGKHQILYDDGDRKEYTLRKKTIEWL